MNEQAATALLPGLPAYEGGRVSDAAYRAGVGLHARFNDGKTFTYRRRENDSWIDAQLQRLITGGYAFSAPCEGERFGPLVCRNGYSTFELQRDGDLYTVRQAETAYDAMQDEDVLVRAVTQTSEAAFRRYLRTLEERRFSAVMRREADGNVFCTLTNGEAQVHASFFSRQATARFALDRVSAPIDQFGGGAPLENEPLEICQFGLYYSYMRPGVSADCGMLYIIKLPDRSLFVIDGGEREQATDAACAEVLRVMREMSGAEREAPVRIAGWFCTHAHDDHYDLFAKLLLAYHEQLRVERVLFNFPANEHYLLSLQTYVLLERLHRFCPTALYIKPHTGQRFTLAGVDFDILLTHEDAACVTGSEHFGVPEQRDDFNNTSTVLKLSCGGVSFLVPGDIGSAAADTLLSYYGEQTLRCTAVQAAHHLINRLPRLYAAVRPDIALVPQSVRKALDTNEKYLALLETVPAQHQYYAGSATDVFAAENGRFRLIKRYPIVGGAYDGSLT